MKAKNSGSKFQRSRTLRLTADEDTRLEVQADMAGISVSEYILRLFFGGRPIVSRTA